MCIKILENAHKMIHKLEQGDQALLEETFL